MKHLVFAAVAACCAAGSAAVDPSLQDAWLRGTTDKPALSYKPGEEMVFTIEMYGISNSIPADAWELFLSRSGDDGKHETKTVPLPLPGNKLEYRTSLATNGFVRLYAQVMGKGNKFFRRDGKKWPYDRIYFDGGAGVNPDSLGGVAEPADFDSFWAKRRERLAKLPLVADMKPVSSNANGTCYAVSVNCAGGRPATFYMSVPSKPGAKVPAHMTFWGYSGDRMPGKVGISPDRIVADLNPHGFELGREKEYYAEFYRSVASGCRYPGDSKKKGPAGYCFDYFKNLDAESSYFSGMTWRLMRAIQFVKSLPQWDGKNFSVEGGSQGGLQAIWAAGLDHAVTKCSSSITWCCDFGGSEFGRLRGDWYVRHTPAIDYFDPVNIAKRIPKTCQVTIPRAGLGDYTCPPSGLAVLYNNIAAPKKITWVQGSEHGYSEPPRPDEKFTFTSADYRE